MKVGIRTQRPSRPVQKQEENKTLVIGQNHRYFMLVVDPRTMNILTPAHICTYGPQSNHGPVWMGCADGSIVLGDPVKSNDPELTWVIVRGQKKFLDKSVAFSYWLELKSKYGTASIKKIMDDGKVPASKAEKSIRRMAPHFPKGTDFGERCVIVADPKNFPPENENNKTIKSISGKWVGRVAYYGGKARKTTLLRLK